MFAVKWLPAFNSIFEPAVILYADRKPCISRLQTNRIANNTKKTILY